MYSEAKDGMKAALEQRISFFRSRRGGSQAALFGARRVAFRSFCAGFRAPMRMRQHAEQADAVAAAL